VMLHMAIDSGTMSWKAWLEGHQFDLKTLSELFPIGDLVVLKDPSGDYYLESPDLVNSDGQLDDDAAQALIRRVNGVGRATYRGFRPVRIKQYTAPNGTVNIVAKGGLELRPFENRAFDTVTPTGPSVSESLRGARYVKLAKQDEDVADVIRILGQPDPLDWYDVYKVWEIIEQKAGGSRQVDARGWATRADIDRLTASANHPGISGDKARHARMPGTPGPNHAMSLNEGAGLVRRLSAIWIESHPSY
jgi:hypothetical protein